MNSNVAETISSNDETLKNQIPGSGDIISPNELTVYIQGCVLNDRMSQKKIYTTFFEFGMAICNRYATSHEDAIEILNDGFLKIFKEIHRYSPSYADVVGSFRGWIRRIMIYTAIDHFRRNKKHRFTAHIDDKIIQVPSVAEDAIDKISYRDILESIQKLTPVYKSVLRLFMIEGFSHQEISKTLGIKVGTSKSNLAKAKMQLQKILFQRNQIKYINQDSERENDTIEDLVCQNKIPAICQNSNHYCQTICHVKFNH